ncbi:Site-specific recombinase XerD [Pustulibacterium marinum]|uniref:Site-specific recombinase XerD n=1 Tax=Pustulibacterium marinum TaxID=1224947 RepID=A0A1I7IVJ8_9FLAO|nr:site-specific integrase [Pustulibacterium marinum]SFU76965.1 Site-specific recombinase XerD [Pustulibacterium marinum]
MQNFNQKTSRHKHIAFLDFKPAELRMKKDWIIVYYAKNPATGKLQRYRVRVPKMSNKTQRERYGKRMVLEINKKLESGWLPVYSNVSVNEFKTLDFCFNTFLAYTEKEIEAGNKRPDTLRAYKSYIAMLKKWINEKKLTYKLILEVSTSVAINYLDWMYLERNTSAATYNNHLTFLKNFANFCLKRGYIKENFAQTIERKKKTQKKRKVFTPEVKQKIKKLQEIDKAYYTLCMATYFCFVRRTELTKLKVKDISFHKQYITIEGEASKNGKKDIVTIPDKYMMLLVDHVKSASSENYLFSGDEFQPGKKQLTPKKISDTWTKYRKQLNFGSEYQFYSLKDTGITDLLTNGVPAIKVRDQARHSDIRITEQYTPNLSSADEVVKGAKFNF